MLGDKQLAILCYGHSYLMNPLKEKLKENNIETLIIDVKQNDPVLSENDATAVLVWASEELFGDRDVVKKHMTAILMAKLPLFITGNPEELEKSKASIPAQMIRHTFVRPLDVTKVVEAMLGVDEVEERKTILAVDDSGPVLRMIKTLLEDKYDVVVANSGMRAIKFLTLNRPDLILLDYEMPVCDGAQVLEMIREEEDFADIPVIFLTGRADAEVVKHVMELHPEGYLLKSLPPETIHQTVDNFFAKKKK